MSWGVQITGNGRLKSSITRKTRGRITGFAMCLQFHVNRKSMRWTAAQAIWSASNAALGGKIARSIISAAKSSILTSSRSKPELGTEELSYCFS